MAKATDRAGRRPWGGLEDEVLAVLWAASGPVTATAVQNELGGDLAYGTITTILGRLRAKGLVVRSQVGRTYEYAPAQDAASHTASRMHSLLVSRGDRAAVLARFVSELSPEEERLLQAVLRDLTEPDEASDGAASAGDVPPSAVPPESMRHELVPHELVPEESVRHESVAAGTQAVDGSDAMAAAGQMGRATASAGFTEPAER
ncbi:MAG TPA: BlaI/MecI/CopY family transcriptional regulator [Micromonosporaceae bacterium]|jgi:predicted transcriptional regulator|nr:BlaI/MecI/CopY family transcriptional regulator [Micromonosporaceae bacterium]